MGLESEIETYRRRKHRERIQAERERYREKKRANPVPCSNCKQVKPASVVGPILCGACYVHQRRHGSNRPIHTAPLAERLSASQTNRYARQRGLAIDAALVETWRSAIRDGASKRAIAKSHGLSIATVISHLNRVACLAGEGPKSRMEKKH